MNLNPLGSNQIELDLCNGTQVFFSYRTPVAAFISGQGYFRTDKKWSVTTTKHINKWINAPATTKPQEFFYSLIAKVK
jgi:hypothetical protein